MKRLLSIGLAAVFTLSMVLSGCGSNGSSSKDSPASSGSTAQAAPEATAEQPVSKTKIRMTYWNKEDTVKTLLSLIEEKLADVELEYQFIDNSQYGNIIETQLAAGQGPDIIGNGPVAVQKHVKLGYAEDLSRYADKYSESGKLVYSVDGKLYALPGISWFEGIFYNKDIFEKYGLTPPKTFEEELAIHETLKNAGIKPQAMGAKSWEPMMKSSMGFVMNDFLFTDAGEGFDEEFGKGTKTLDGNWNKSIARWAELIKRGYITKDMLGIDYDQALAEFATGEAAMWESGPWAVDTIKQKNPDLNFDMFPFYGDEPGTGYLIGGPGVGFEINKASEGKEAAFKVMDLISTPEGQKAFWNDNKGGSSYLVGVELEMPAEFASCAEVLKAGNVYCPWNVWSNQGYVNFGNIINDYGKYFQELLSGGKDVDEVLKAIDKRAAELRK